MTLVTLDCTHVDIAMSVSVRGDAGYSPAVLRLRGHHRCGYRRPTHPSRLPTVSTDAVAAPIDRVVREVLDALAKLEAA